MNRCTILFGLVLFAVLLPSQGFCNETLSAVEIENLLSGRTIVNATLTRKADYHKLIHSDGRWTGVKANGELAGAGFWRVAEPGLFCQSHQVNRWAERCVTIKKEGDHYASYFEKTTQGATRNWKMSIWSVVDDTPATVAYKDQIATEYDAVIAAYEKLTGNSYEQVLAANRVELEKGSDAMIAEYKRKALEALPAAGTK